MPKNKRLQDYTKDKLWTTEEVSRMLALREGETLKEVGEWLENECYDKEGNVWIADIDRKEIEALKRGEMPNGR